MNLDCFALAFWIYFRRGDSENGPLQPRIRSFFVVFACCLPALLPGLAADWPQWLGPNRDAISTDRGAAEARHHGARSFPSASCPLRSASPLARRTRACALRCVRICGCLAGEDSPRSPMGWCTACLFPFASPDGNGARASGPALGLRSISGGKRRWLGRGESPAGGDVRTPMVAARPPGEARAYGGSQSRWSAMPRRSRAGRNGSVPVAWSRIQAAVAPRSAAACSSTRAA